MRREIANQKVAVKRAAAPAAQAFIEAQTRAELREEPELDLAQAHVEPLGSGGPPTAGAPAPMPPPGGPPQDLMMRVAASPRPAPPREKLKMSVAAYEKTSEELQLESTGAKVVETGFWLWRNVIVPPNVYVVHTRRGKADPVTIGLGKSFRYNPLVDSYLVVPAAMQTIGIFARCITAEKQGVNVLAYVQWLISDFSLAYKRLDFSNINDPMGIVNAQLKEQAEAAIKDTVATMSVEQVLKDKAPIIQELTERMKAVAEGRDGDGLGLKIVTVQIKEAMVASTSLWENLQAPFRHEKARIAKLSEIETEAEIHRRTREAQLEREAADAKASSEIAKLRAQVELENREATLASQVRQQELAQKAEQDEQRYRQETELQRVAQQEQLALVRIASQRNEVEATEALLAAKRAAELAELRSRVALDRERQEAELAAERAAEAQRVELQLAADQAELARARGEAEVERMRQETANLRTPTAIQGELVKVLPQIAAHMPDIQEYRYVGVAQGDGGAFGALPEFLAKAMGVASSFGWRPQAGAEPRATSSED